MNNVNWRTEYSDIIFWTAISALLLAIKLGAFYIDPTPRILLGDSGVYLSTALDHRSMPYERSFTYGYLIDFFAGPHHAVGRLILTQVLAAAASALLLGICLRAGFRASSTAVAVACFAIAVEPLQLAYERFVLTEAFAGLAYASVVALGIGYLRTLKIALLLLVVLAGTVLLSLRMNAMLFTWIVGLPLPIVASQSLGGSKSKKLWLHVGVVFMATYSAHFGYKQVFGYMAGGPPLIFTLPDAFY